MINLLNLKSFSQYTSMNDSSHPLNSLDHEQLGQMSIFSHLITANGCFQGHDSALTYHWKYFRGGDNMVNAVIAFTEERRNRLKYLQWNIFIDIYVISAIKLLGYQTMERTQCH